MAIARLFFGCQFREGLFDLRKIEHRIVAEASGPLEMVEDAAYGDSAKDGKRSAIAGGGDDADESTGAVLGGDAFKFAKDASVIGIIVGVGTGLVRLGGGVTSGVNAGSAVKSVDLETRIVGDDDLPGEGEAVLLGF